MLKSSHKMGRRVLSFVLSFIMVMSCAFGFIFLPNKDFYITVNAANLAPKTNNLDFLLSLKNDRTVSVYTIPLSEDLYGYDNYMLTGNARVRLNKGKSYKVQIVGSSKQYKSVRLKDSNGNSIWFSAKSILGNTVGSSLYNYQLVSNVNYYSGNNGSTKKGTLYYDAKKLGSSANDVTVIGRYGNWVNVYKNGDMYLVKANELFKTASLLPLVWPRKGFIIKPRVDINGYDFRNMQLAMKVKNGSNSDKATVVVNNVCVTAPGSDIQWKVNYDGNGFYTIQNCKSGKFLNVANGSTNSGADLWQYWNDGSDAMKFQIIKNTNGYYFIRSKLGTYVDLAGGKTNDGNNVQLYSGNMSKAQQWMIT